MNRIKNIINRLRCFFLGEVFSINCCYCIWSINHQKILESNIGIVGEMDKHDCCGICRDARQPRKFTLWSRKLWFLVDQWQLTYPDSQSGN